MAERQRDARDLADGWRERDRPGTLTNPGPTWHVEDAADFNGDGKSDILWQNDNGTPAIWLMDGVSAIGGGHTHQSWAGWHVEDAADFNGDGKSDILWQNDNGTPAIWLMDGVTAIGAAHSPILGRAGMSKTLPIQRRRQSDILWQNANGTPGDLADGRRERDRREPLRQPRADLALVDSCDFDGDRSPTSCGRTTMAKPASGR